MTQDNTRQGATGIDDIERLVRAGGRREAPGAARRESARAAVRDAWRTAVRARARRRWAIAGLPALAAAAVLAIAVWPTTPPAPPTEVVARVARSTAALQLRHGAIVRPIAAGDDIPGGALVETPAGVVAAVSLAGGGELRQNGSTSVRWTAPRRVSVDRGQIYVDTGGAGSAIVVETSAGPIHDIGTQFFVDVRDDQVSVRVRSGAVRLESPAGQHEASAGHEILVRHGAAAVERPAPAFGAEWDWILEGTPFRLEGATLARFVTWVETEGGMRVEFRPARLREEVSGAVLHGSIQGLSMREAIATILPAAGLAHRLEEGRVIIERAGGVRP